MSVIDPANPADARRQVLKLTLAVEGGLLLISLAIGWACWCLPWEPWDHPAALGRNLLWGLGGTVPMLLLLPVFIWVPLRSFRRIEEILNEVFLPACQHLSVWEIAVVAALAGLGEELFFRGLLLHGVSQWPSVGPVTALIVSSVIFGLAHAITPGYVIIAGLIGLYLGGLFLLSGSLLAVVIAHGLYDFVALLVLIHRYRAQQRLLSQQDDLPGQEQLTSDLPSQRTPS